MQKRFLVSGRDMKQLKVLKFRAVVVLALASVVLIIASIRLGLYSGKVTYEDCTQPCRSGAGTVEEDNMISSLLAELNSAEDIMSAEGQLRFLLGSSRCLINKSGAWHEQARLQASLAGYLTRSSANNMEHKSATCKQSEALLRLVEHKLYPWIPHQHHNSLEWKRQMSGRGMVTCIPSKYLSIAMTSLKGLRNAFRRDLPIHVYYADENDLDVHSRQRLEAIENVHTFSLARIFPIHLEGYQVKPFAMLASGFAEVIWFDADLVFLTEPENLFDDVEYKDTGTLYFHDRPVLGWGFESGASINWSWVHSVVGHGSDFLRSSSAFKGQASNIVDSSAVVMHVSRNLPAMLIIAGMNLDPDTYKHVWGDKETFWLGFELLKQPWSLNRWGMSGITFLPINESGCEVPGVWEDPRGVDLPACGHMGPNNVIQMIHFSESKIRGPAPYTALPVGLTQARNKKWHATCVHVKATALDQLHVHQLRVFQTYVEIHTERSYL